MRCALLLALLLCGCADPGTASGPGGSPPAASEPSPAHSQPPSSPEQRAPSAAPDDDDSATRPVTPAPAPAPPGLAGDDDDSAGAKAGATEQLCADRKDNDGDRATDCDDTDCWAQPECAAPAPQDWAEQGPGPDLSDEERQAPGPEGADGGPRRPEDDGIGVGCTDYIDCVCGLAKAEAGRSIAGYSHQEACAATATLIGNQVEEYCGEELDKLKQVLADALDAYKEAKITPPATCN
ncbi:MAG: hypothetical protein CMP23_13790 [Rickettsiales bacterium]|nr:hypothetical protein [Rickettsiales bacterium]